MLLVYFCYSIGYESLMQNLTRKKCRKWNDIIKHLVRCKQIIGLALNIAEIIEEATSLY